MVLALVLEMLQRLLGLLENILPPFDELDAEILPLALAHERLPVGGTIRPYHQPKALAVPVPVGLIVGPTVLASSRLHLPSLRARDRRRGLPARLAIYPGSVTETIK